MNILLTDDDRDLVDLLSFALSRAGFDVLAAYDAPTALKLVDRADFGVLDVNLGSWDGFDLLKEVRRRSQIPIIMLTARDAEDDKVRGLELGADDYLTKPFSHRELVARIRANLRRRGQEWAPASPTEAVVTVGPLRMNVAEHSVQKNGQPLNLTVTEFRLLQFLMVNAGGVVPTRIVLRQVWGYDDPTGADVVRVTVHRLRRKLGEDPSNPHLLHTLPGVGVMLKAVDE